MEGGWLIALNKFSKKIYPYSRGIPPCPTIPILYPTIPKDRTLLVRKKNVLVHSPGTRSKSIVGANPSEVIIFSSVRLPNFSNLNFEPLYYQNLASVILHILFCHFSTILFIDFFTFTQLTSLLPFFPITEETSCVSFYYYYSITHFCSNLKLRSI